MQYAGIMDSIIKPMDSNGRHYLRSLFEPDSVAVIGATEAAGKIGAHVETGVVDDRDATAGCIGGSHCSAPYLLAELLSNVFQ